MKAKRGISLSLGLCLLFGLAGCGGGASPTPAGELPVADASSFTLDYFEDDGGYVIGDYRGSMSEFRIPSNANVEGEEYPIVGIADYAFYGRKGINRVVLPDTIRFIGDHSFGNSGITDLYVTPSLFRVHRYAFDETNIKYTLSDHVYYLPSVDNPYCVAYRNDFSAQGGIGDLNPACQSVTDGALDGVDALGGKATFTDQLVSIGDCLRDYWDYSKLPEGFVGTFLHLGGNALRGCAKIAEVNLLDKEYPLGQLALHDAVNLKTVVFTEGFKSIGNEAFYGCKTLTSVMMPGTLESIGEAAFLGCDSLASISLPNSLTSIGVNAFALCPSLPFNAYDNALYLGNPDNPYLALIKASDISISSCEIASSCLLLGASCFGGCPRLTSIAIPDSVVAIDKYAFSNAESLAEVSLGDGVTSIGQYAFFKCSNLTTINFPSSLVHIRSEAFSYCYKLASISFPSSLVGIENMAFSNCQSLTKVDFSEGLRYIAYQAFYNCAGLSAVRFPSTLTTVGSEAFGRCSKLETIYIPSSVTTISTRAFSNIASSGNLYCGASARPEGWKFELPEGWTIHWGYAEKPILPFEG